MGAVAVWRGAHVGAGFLMGTVACGGPMLGQSVSEELHPWKGLMLEQRTVAYGRAPTLEQGMRVRKEPDTKHFELTTPTPFPAPLGAGEEVEESRVKLGLVRRESKVCMFNKLMVHYINFPKLSLFCP